MAKGLKCRSVGILKRKKGGRADILGKGCRTFSAKRYKLKKVAMVHRVAGAYVQRAAHRRRGKPGTGRALSKRGLSGLLDETLGGA